MTHTVHPYAHRLGIIRDWKSRWFAADKKSYRENLAADAAIRGYFKKRAKGLHISDIEIERSAAEVRIILHTARPGLVIGRAGEGATKLRNELTRLVATKTTGGVKRSVKLDIMEIRQPETSAAIVGYMIAEGLEKRMPFRRVLKQTVEKVMAVREVIGIRIVISGRLAGADMSRTEQIKRGRVPLQTFRANILLPYGLIGIKVWIYLGETFNAESGTRPASERTAPTNTARR